MSVFCRALDSNPYNGGHGILNIERLLYFLSLYAASFFYSLSAEVEKKTTVNAFTLYYYFDSALEAESLTRAREHNILNCVRGTIRSGKLKRM